MCVFWQSLNCKRGVWIVDVIQCVAFLVLAWIKGSVNGISRCRVDGYFAVLNGCFDFDQETSAT